MHKYDKIYILGVIIFSIMILVECSRAFAWANITVEKENSDDIYFYGIEDSQIKNPKLLTYFVDNVKSGLESSLMIYMVGDYEEDLMYGIVYKENKFVVYTSINNEIIDTQSFLYLNSYKYGDYTYYFLSNQESLDEVLVEEYFMGDIFEIFEIGREKIQ